MVRLSLFSVLAGSVLLGGGCAHFIESRTVARFTESLQNESLEEIRAQASPEFEQRALRMTEAIDDLKILRIPTGKTSVVEVADVDENHKRVTVKVGDSKKKIFYELVRDEARNWVVDDIYMKQKHANVTAYRSVSEQMDLLLTVREYVGAWDGGNREEVLAVAAAELRSRLAALPPAYLAAVTSLAVDSGPQRSRYRPRAQMEDQLAVVRLPRSTGETVVTLELTDEGWLVRDVAVDDREQTIPSLSRLADAGGAAVAFLRAYAAEDKAALAAHATGDLYQGSLEIGDLSLVPLPSADAPPSAPQLTLNGLRADLILRGDKSVYRLTLQQQSSADDPKQGPFRVDDVTVYEIESGQEKRLAAVFTGHAMTRLFSRALSQRDLDALRHSATLDFTKRVWRRLNDASILALPLEGVEPVDPQIVDTRFQGPVTNVVVTQGERTLTYVLREVEGRLLVDDVEVPLSDQPASLKQRLEVLIPLYEFAAGMQLADLELLQRHSSDDFNRVVWTQTEEIPDSGLPATELLAAAVSSITVAGDEARVVLGDDRWGVEVSLAREHDPWVVADVLLIAGPLPAQRAGLKHTLRQRLARSMSQRGPKSADVPDQPAPTQTQPFAPLPIEDWQ